MAIPKRMANAKTAKAIQEKFNHCTFSFRKSEDKTMIIVKMIEVPESLIISEEEFNKKYSMEYKHNLNHAFKPGIKEDLIELIISHNPVLEVDDISFNSINCTIIKENKKNPLDISYNVGFPCELCPIEDDEEIFF